MDPNAEVELEKYLATNYVRIEADQQISIASLPEGIASLTPAELGDALFREFELNEPPVETVRLTADRPRNPYGALKAIFPSSWDPNEGIVIEDSTIVEVTFHDLPLGTYYFSASFWTLAGSLSAFGPWGSTTASLNTGSMAGLLLASVTLADAGRFKVTLRTGPNSDYLQWILSVQLSRA